MIQNQLRLFAFYLMCGIIISISFDFFRALRKSSKTADFATHTEDFAFFIITTLFLIIAIYKYGDGELRWYISIAIILGAILYYCLISRFVLKTIVIIINSLIKSIDFVKRKIIDRIIIYLKKIITKIRKNTKYIKKKKEN